MAGGHMAAAGVRNKSYEFALMVVRTVQPLRRRKEYILSSQFLKAGTSIGANIEEANAAQTKRDFVAKMSIASKEARECRYWIRLLRDSNYLDTAQYEVLAAKCDELIRMLTAIVKTSQTQTIKN
jgi:four helix bundle protein